MQHPSHNRNRVRLIGGQWRSRVLHFPDSQDLRPTPDRVRETLFNWLQPCIHGARCLDLFAGSGALGLEALSRGADSIVALETHPIAAQALLQNATSLQAVGFELIRQDALQFLDQPANRRFDIVFIDPPFAAHLHARCCALLQANGWLAPNALVYLEDGHSLSEIALPASWHLVRHKQAGDVYYGMATMETEPAQDSL